MGWKMCFSGPIMYESMRNGFVEPKLFIPAPGSAPAYLLMNMISFQKIKCIFVFKKYRFINEVITLTDFTSAHGSLFIYCGLVVGD